MGIIYSFFKTLTYLWTTTTNHSLRVTKSTTYKKYGAALGVAGISVAAALLLAGGSTKAAHTEFPTDLIEMPEDMIESNTTDFVDQEVCMASYNRIWAG